MHIYMSLYLIHFRYTVVVDHEDLVRFVSWGGGQTDRHGITEDTERAGLSPALGTL